MCTSPQAPSRVREPRHGGANKPRRGFRWALYWVAQSREIEAGPLLRTATDVPNRGRVSGAYLARCCGAQPPSWRSQPLSRTYAISLPFASK
jgi:hypothetical protein